jgi:hypothetical protein
MIDLATFSHTLKLDVQKVFLSRDERGKKRILDISDPFSVPCIVVLYWCGEVSGWPDYLKKSLDVQIKFYGYKEILNKPEGCPW